MGTGDHARCQPLLGAGNPDLAHRGDQPGAHHAGLARAARTHHGDEPLSARQAAQHLGDQRVPAEEVLGVALGERPQSLEGVDALLINGRELAGGGAASQTLVVQQDLLLQPAHLRRRIDAELLAYLPPEPVEGP